MHRGLPRTRPFDPHILNSFANHFQLPILVLKQRHLEHNAAGEGCNGSAFKPSVGRGWYLVFEHSLGDSEGRSLKNRCSPSTTAPILELFREYDRVPVLDLGDAGERFTAAIYVTI